MDEKKKKVIFLLAVVLCAISVGYRVMHPYEQMKVDKLTYTNDPVVTRNQNKKNSMTDSMDRNSVVGIGVEDSATANSENDSDFGKIQEPLYSDPLIAAVQALTFPKGV